MRGDAGLGLSILGTTLAAASVRANGADEQVGEWRRPASSYLLERRGCRRDRCSASTGSERRTARDARIHTILEGTSEIQRLVTARTISGVAIR